MTDIVEQLERAIAMAAVSGQVWEGLVDPLHQLALGEIKRLRAEVDHLNAHIEAVAKDTHTIMARRWGEPIDNHPIEGLDADGNVTFTFTAAHSWRDVVNWIKITEVDAEIVRELLAEGQNDE